MMTSSVPSQLQLLKLLQNLIHRPQKGPRPVGPKQTIKMWATMKTSSNLKLKIWIRQRSILPPKPLAVVAHAGAAEVEAAAAEPMEMANLDLNVPVVLHEAEEDAGADGHKTILSSWIGQMIKDLLAEDETNGMIRGTIPMTASWTMTANL